MKVANAYPIMACVVIIVFALTLINLHESEQSKLPDIRASVSRGNPEKGKLGEFIITVYNRWEKDVVGFYDTGIDQELNFVDIDGKLEWTADPNFPDLETWKKRYQEVRKEYITGRKAKSS